jgi:hypothetical protein
MSPPTSGNAQAQALSKPNASGNAERSEHPRQASQKKLSAEEDRPAANSKLRRKRQARRAGTQRKQVRCKLATRKLSANVI